MSRLHNKAVALSLVSCLLFFNSGLAVSSCTCCSADKIVKMEKDIEYRRNGKRDHIQYCRLYVNTEKPQKQKQCNCAGDCECSFLCNVPEYNNAVTTTIQHFPDKLLKQIIQQPIIHIVEYFASPLMHLRPGRAKLNPLKLPQTIPLRI